MTRALIIDRDVDLVCQVNNLYLMMVLIYLARVIYLPADKEGADQREDIVALI